MVFQTWRGTLYVVDPSPGIHKNDRIVAVVNSYPDAAATLPDFPDSDVVVNCLYRAVNDKCVTGNIIAVHPETDAIYNTVQGFVRNSPDSFVQRWVYLHETQALFIDDSWNKDIELIGGSPSSPDISFDGDALFVNDWSGNIYALDPETGDILHQGEIGYTPVGSNTTAPEVDTEGNVIGSFITFQRPVELDVPNPYFRMMRYRPDSGFSMIKIFDGQDGNTPWIMRRNPAGGLVDKDEMAVKVRFVAIALNGCGGCSEEGDHMLVVADPHLGRIVSANKIRRNLSGTFSIGTDRSVIVSTKPDEDGTGSVRPLLHRYDALN